MLEIGSLIDGKYKILSKIGQGGMSVVYMAINERANKTWAIKEVRKDGIQNFEVVKQGLIVETDMLKKLHHPNIPSIIDVIEDDEKFLIVMDYIEGNSLQKALKDYGPQPQEDVVEWAKQLCDALGYLHSRKPPIIYRDMKPANVMLKPDGTVSLIDFGTAREYKAGNTGDTSVLGTRGYAAPEQYGGMGQTDARTDIYCLGAALHQLLTGQDPCQPPYVRFPLREYNAALSSGLEEIIMKCVEDIPENRYQSCSELMYALTHYNELDVEYKRRQNLKLAVFITTTVLTVASFGASIGFNTLEAGTKTSSYEAYLDTAGGSAADEDKIENYRNAINLDPTRLEAYTQLLEQVFMQDDNYSSEEDTIMREILAGGNDSKRNNEMIFKSNIVGYEEFAYQLGISYFYTYEESGNKAYSEKWLNVAASSVTLETAKVERARRLSQIASYYAKIGRESLSGDASVSYLDYWIALIELSEGNIVVVDNSTTAIMMYRELVYQIYSNTDKFRKDGVTKKEMLEQLDNITERIVGSEDKAATDINLSSEKDRVRTMVAELEYNITLAKRAVESSFSNLAGGGVN